MPITTNLGSLNPTQPGELDTTLCDKFCQWFETGQCFSPVTPVSSINKTDLYDIAEIFQLKKICIILFVFVQCNNITAKLIVHITIDKGIIKRFYNKKKISVPITTNLVSSNPTQPGELDTTLCDKVCQWFETGRWFSPGTSTSSSKKTNHHDITEVLFKVALNTINKTHL
jgi:hypothetical protein